MELAASRAKPKRKRGHNWSTKEKIILFECVKDYLHIVSDCRNAVEVRKKKNLTWAWIAKLAKEMGVYVKETLKIKTQWKRMRIAAKKNIHAYQKGLTVDGKIVIPSELDWNVYNAMNVCFNKRRQHFMDGNELGLSCETKNENPVDCAFDNTSNSLQISDEIYSIEEDSLSSQSEISINSQNSNGDRASQEGKPVLKRQILQINLNAQIPQTSQTQINVFPKTDDKMVRPNELDWNLYNAISNICSETRPKSTNDIVYSPPNEIKNELSDNYPFENIPSALHNSHMSTGTQTFIEEYNDGGNILQYPAQQKEIENQILDRNTQPSNVTINDQDKILAVQLKIEEAKLKEIEERIHQQRVLFELNKTLLQKQIENESVKKYM